ncbi:MAG: MerR family transcriptional regulator, light-induced transcriptional regulator [Solirubrobacteraceae bacterium]|jgi:DNA-binding transcriptional MerR regulator|nr:MerR family transcriptional regulator, light-induced transcriptional regulator [Solirubrobacteraceae bacterium]
MCGDICPPADNCSDSRSVRYLKTSEAASLLNVSPNTLRAWERRFGYPKPQRSPGKHRLYTHGEIAALKDALQEGLSISSAVSRAREGLSADSDSLIGALSSFDRTRADGAMEAALALRSLERSVEEILLPSLDELEERHGADSARWAFASRWADEWLKRAQRLTPPPVRDVSLVIGDASKDALDPDAPAIRALELLCARAGAKLLCLSVRGVAGLGDALAIAAPNAVVLAGGHARDDEVARWAYAVRSASGALPVCLFRREVLRPLRSRTTGAAHLSSSPSEAQSQILELVEADRLSPRHDDAPARPTRLIPREKRAG